ncbi:MAG: phage terminase large subunit family protein [Planctomycetes bacterium]|nr:phage terminase large subunit family protein [Planctomycetota bacterium]
MTKKLKDIAGGRTHSGEDYEVHRQREAQRSRDKSRSGRDIGPIPPCLNPERRAACSKSLKLFCETYFRAIFYLAWCRNQLKTIEKIEVTVFRGGLFAVAEPRGEGKTRLCEAGALLGILEGYRRFIVPIGATTEEANNSLESMKNSLAHNDLLLEDYPEVCYPVRCLEGITARARGQLCEGRPTNMVWTRNKIVLPSIPGSKSAGGVIRTAGLTGQIRGMYHKCASGEVIRPDQVILDDPQTDESAMSLSQNRQREKIISGAVLGLAGPGKKISAVMPCTVIAPGDMADSILDRKKHPEWHGERMKMVYEWPKRMDLWEQYREIRHESLQNDGAGEPATKFYRKHRKEMDAGAVVAWPERKEDDEISGLQCAMNLRFRDEKVFFSEYQNDPLPLDDAPSSEVRLDPDLIVQLVNGIPRCTVPLWSTRITAFIDVQKACLWWMVCAWSDGFTGAIVDYGTWPDQQKENFTLSQVSKTLQRAFPRAGLEGAIRGGLDGLGAHLLARDWIRQDKSIARIDRLFVDANWGDSTDTVYGWCEQSPHSAVITPAHGRFIGATSTPFSEYKKRPGERVGTHWRMPLSAGKRSIRHIVTDVNWWKSFMFRRFATNKGDKGSLSMFGRRPQQHEMLAEHLTSEKPVPVTAKGRTVNEWKLIRPGRDNHWWDCLVGCAVAASMQGISLEGEAGATATRKKTKLSELQAQKRAHR